MASHAPRRLLLLAGDPKWAQRMTSQVLTSWKELNRDARFLRADVRDPPQRAWMGQELDAAVLSAHRRRFLDTFGAVCGALKGGGVLILQTPSFQSWREERIGSRWCTMLEQIESGDSGLVQVWRQEGEPAPNMSDSLRMLAQGQQRSVQTLELKPNREQRELFEIILGIKASRPLLVLGQFLAPIRDNHEAYFEKLLIT